MFKMIVETVEFIIKVIKVLSLATALVAIVLMFVMWPITLLIIPLSIVSAAIWSHLLEQSAYKDKLEVYTRSGGKPYTSKRFCKNKAEEQAWEEQQEVNRQARITAGLATEQDLQ